MMNTALQKANGPASVGALPDRGSIPPTKEKEMNKAVNTTQAAPPATLADLFEEPIDGAHRMASILARLLEGALGKDLGQYRRPDCYHLTRDQVEDIMFSIYQTQDFIKQIQTALEEAVQ